ncbi:ankyrin repeat domain-containing protein [Candidatus Babela massiliensis]|uniref:Ankyrin repeats containing protein n=1 Tax=Candidatus Babela massiliensis TaxID=673862 RepID=V6DGF3_9BACT|nr:ankyrin repeat domain-containing protein [Candidatus Babela massiliensis]CDK30682.1 Ankyrin repeats containing protein [Candidatus Babela massiliensis]
MKKPIILIIINTLLIFSRLFSMQSADVIRDYLNLSLSDIINILIKNQTSDINLLNFLDLILIKSIQESNIKILKYMIKDLKLDIDKLYYDFTPLMIASLEGSDEIVEKLLEWGANPNVQNSLGDTALIYAVQNRDSLITALLLKNKKVDKNLQNKEDKIALAYATSFPEIKYLFNYYKCNK